MAKKKRISARKPSRTRRNPEQSKPAASTSELDKLRQLSDDEMEKIPGMTDEMPDTQQRTSVFGQPDGDAPEGGFVRTGGDDPRADVEQEPPQQQTQRARRGDLDVQLDVGSSAGESPEQLLGRMVELLENLPDRIRDALVEESV